MTEKQDMGVVTQADRELFKSLIAADELLADRIDRGLAYTSEVASIAAFRLASQADQGEAVAWLYTRKNGEKAVFLDRHDWQIMTPTATPLYAHPPAAEPVGLREALQLAHDTLHECTAVLTACDCAKVARAMAVCRKALSLPTPARTDDAGVGGEVEKVARIISAGNHGDPWWWKQAFDDGLDETAARLRADDEEVAASVLAALSPTPDRGEVIEALRALQPIACGDWCKEGRHIPECQKAQDVLAALTQPAPEPVAYSYDLAMLIHPDGEYYGWENRLTSHKPNVPDRAIRNLVPLYTR